MHRLVLCAVGLALLSLPLFAAEQATPSTVESVYMGLSSGPLQQAVLAKLPAGVVLAAGTVTMTKKQVTEEIARQKPEERASLSNQQFFVMEQLATKTLLLAEARTWATQTKRAFSKDNDADRELINAYLQDIADKVSVTDDEAQAFYQENKDFVGESKFDEIKSMVKNYLLREKRQAAVTTRINTLSARTRVEVDAEWTKAQATAALNTPVDRARRSGKPTFVEFGSTGCKPCEMMEPIIAELRETFSAQCNIVFVQVREQPILASRYGISVIPVQAFYDKDGKEVFRHIGFFPREQVLAKLAELGVK